MTEGRRKRDWMKEIEGISQRTYMHNSDTNCVVIAKGEGWGLDGGRKSGVKWQHL